MIKYNRFSQKIFLNNLHNRQLRQKGYFAEGDRWIAFDNSSGDLFTEEFQLELLAILWLRSIIRI